MGSILHAWNWAGCGGSLWYSLNQNNPNMYRNWNVHPRIQHRSPWRKKREQWTRSEAMNRERSSCQRERSTLRWERKDWGEMHRGKESYCQQRGTEFCVWFGCLLVLVFFMNNMGYDTILLFQSTSRLLNTHHSVSQGVNENETWGQAAIAHPLEPPQYLVTICCWLRHSRPLSCPWVLRNTFSLSRCSLEEQVGWQPFQVK